MKIYFRSIDDSLIISNVTADHGGLYRCEASNEGGSESSSTRLLVVTSVVIARGPRDTQVSDE